MNISCCLIFTFLFSLNLSAQIADEVKTIILSKASSNYFDWVTHEKINVLDAYTINNTDSILALADAIILTGGEDIYPLHYSDTSNLTLCGPIDHSRDTLELKLFNYAFQNKIPLVGVCRGMQMINVASGGTLFGDIPTQLGNDVIHRNNGEVMHEIAITNNAYKKFIFPSDLDTFLVNSWHHQGLKDIATNINVVASSFDGLPEAVVMDTTVHPFMIGVQFHPERLGNNNQIHLIIRDNLFERIFD